MARMNPAAASAASRLTGKHTLLEVVQALGRCGLEEGEVVTIVRGLLHSGQLNLSGNFRGSLPSDFD